MDSIIKVLVVDDSTFMRGALVRMIEKSPRFKVIDVASNGREGVEKAKALRPDVVTMDVEMPEMNGIEALREIMATVKLPVVMVSTLTEAGAATTLQALELGAVDFIPKSLQDKDKNIFKGAEVIHEKLIAAAGAKVGAAVGPVGMANNATTPVQRPVGMTVKVNPKVVVVGSSTGGPRALQVLLQQLPAGLPVPVLVAQHMPASFTQALAARLDETCPPKVMEAVDGMRPAAGTVYIAPGGMHMRLAQDGSLQVRPEQGESPYKPSVDVLADSAMRVYGKDVLGVMLTGMGNDGAQAFLDIRKAGGALLAQDQASCVVYGMPRAVVENGAATDVVGLGEMGLRIRQLLAA